MTSRERPQRQGQSAKAKSGPIAFFIALLIVALGAIQLIATFHTYALNLAELNNLKKQEASLIQQKQDLENNIDRWNDKAYVTAQARERLGFIFPGEQSVRVMHPEAVTGKTSQETQQTTENTQEHSLPWYSELAYSFKQADNKSSKPTDQSTNKNQPESHTSSDTPSNTNEGEQ